MKNNTNENWLNRWAQGKTGRSVFAHMSAPRPKDNINLLNRKEQTAIFRLRTNHVPLNYHLNRINPQKPPSCPLCNNPSETTDHHLFHCKPLKNLRTTLLPKRPNISNTLYGPTDQLKRTCNFHFMAMCQRARVQASLDR